MEAMTCRLPKRWISSGAMTCACSIRPVALRVDAQQGFKGVQRDAIRFISYGVKGKLKAKAIALDGHGFELFGVDGKNAAG
jgi:hypothetical protein